MKMLITVNGNQYEVDVEVLDDAGQVAAPAPTASAAPAAAAAAPAAAPAQPAAPTAAPTPAPAAAGGGEVPSPIAGNVLEVKVKPGDQVQANDVLLVLEAMKMESNVVSPQAGTVGEVLVKAGDSVTQGQGLVKLS